jgi:hypothetical protein
MTQEPEGGYARPQDPWAGSFEPGVASLPTDPIPQQYEPRPPAEASGDWAPPTYAPAAARRSWGIVGIVALLTLLAAGAGYGAYYVTAKRTNASQGQGAGHTPPATSTSSTIPSPTRSKLDPHDVAVGDCVKDYGVKPKVDLGKVACTMADSYTIIKIVSGASLKENAKGEFDQATAEAACADTAWDSFYAYKDSISTARDILFCMTAN